MDKSFDQIILQPVINEKTTQLAQLNKYTFDVHNDATKIDIAIAFRALIARLYPKLKLTVKSVSILYSRARFRARKRHGRSHGDHKRAIITVEGDSLDFYSA